MLRSSAALLPLLAIAACLGTGPGITPVQTAFNKGVYHYEAGRYDEALAEYEEAVDNHPSDHRARFNLAMTFEARAAELAAAGDAAGAARARDSARGQYEIVLEQRPDHERAAVNLAAMQYEAGDVQGAKARLEALLAGGAQSALPRCALAAHLLHEGDTARAVALLEEARGIAIADPQVNLLLGDARMQDGDKDGAREAYEASLRRDEAHVGARLALARLEIDEGNAGAAETHLRRALLLDPHLAPAHLLMARITETDDPQAAVQHLWAARASLPDGDEPEWVRAKLQELLARLAEAERQSPRD